MHNKILIFINKSSFIKNVLTLVSGSGIAVALPIIVSPILTRIYSPEDMGSLALFSSFVAILGSVSAARYELAIILPKKDRDAINIFIIGFIINLIFSFFLLIILILFGDFISLKLNGIISKKMLILVPIGVFFTGLLNLLNVFNNRIKKYFDLAKASVIKSITLVSIQVSLGFLLKNSTGLIIGETFSKFFANLKLLNNFIQSGFNKDKIQKNDLIFLVKRYAKFPLYDVPATICNVSSFQLIAVFFSVFFTSSTAGLFYFTQKVLGAPVTIISNAVSDVFKERAAKDFIKQGNAKEIYLKTFKKLVLIGLIPSVILYFFVTDLFVFFFSDNWLKAGVYAEIMIPMLYVRFISNPLSSMFYIGEKQKTNLILQLILLLMVSSSFFLFDNDKSVVKSLSFSFSFFYILQIIFSSIIAKIYNGNN